MESCLDLIEQNITNFSNSLTLFEQDKVYQEIIEFKLRQMEAKNAEANPNKSKKSS
jgi:hypothetical protein